ncbi:anaerobic ribonucleoside-triphosphate reductase [Thermosulfurimonas sp. F29]|nr:anaerobic ribonucleoside-triphosphate reductase [Thermosulfurimonas sp. F29]
MGYFRPVHHWNTGKRQEFSERKTVSLSSMTRFAAESRLAREVA